MKALAIHLPLFLPRGGGVVHIVLADVGILKWYVVLGDSPLISH